MSLCITGTSGRIGAAIAKQAVADGWGVIGIDQHAPRVPIAGVEHRVANVSDYNALIHMAAIPAPTGLREHEVHNNNVTGSYNALTAAARLGLRKVVQASSVNATGLAYSRFPKFDYFPLDEAHPTYNEDAYSLSKWICELQADSVARRNEHMTISSMRFHWVIDDRAWAVANDSPNESQRALSLWAYTSIDAAVRACLLAVNADFLGHEVFYICAPDSRVDTPSAQLAAQFYPNATLRKPMEGNASFFDCSKAERLLGWRHDL
jgi:nucleoside-diphosphate-sugar epimerase